MVRRGAALILLVATFGCAEAPSPVPPDTLPQSLPLDDVPLGLRPRPPASDNPLTAERVALGRRLFFDPILSSDKTVACASCHHPDHAFASADARPRGVGGKQGLRRAPTLLNRAYGSVFFWDGRATTLEDQALEPIGNPVEMASSVADAVARLSGDPGYHKQFAGAFDDGVTAKNLAKSLASFERVLLRGNSPTDRFRQRGERDAMTAVERHGLWLYESKGLCWRCHVSPNFTDEAFHNTGVSWGRSPEDLGRFAVTKQDGDRGKYKTPTLRGVGLRPPFMHDGSLATLEDVVEFYNRGGNMNPHLDPVMRPLNLSKEDVAALVAFLKSL